MESMEFVESSFLEPGGVGEKGVVSTASFATHPHTRPSPIAAFHLSTALHTWTTRLSTKTREKDDRTLRRLHNDKINSLPGLHHFFRKQNILCKKENI
eukprot:scaffold1058_cov155-Ochromonas_danica.AAC.37